MNEPVAIVNTNCENNIQWNVLKPQKYNGYFLYTHPVKEQDDYCKAYWGNDNKFVDVFLPNSETEVIRFWNNTHPVKELTDEEMYRLLADAIWAVGLNTDCLDEQNWADGLTVAKAILKKVQEK